MVGLWIGTSFLSRASGQLAAAAAGVCLFVINTALSGGPLPEHRYFIFEGKKIRISDLFFWGELIIT